jgi:beta-glucanase (GH16 family)
MVRRRSLLAIVALAIGLAGSQLTAPAVASTPATPCGPVIYKADGTPWTCTFADDFNGTKLDRSKWLVQTTATSGYDQGGACFLDRSSNVSVSGGHLNLMLRKSSSATTCQSGNSTFATHYSSGMISTYGTFSQTYGRFEFRATFQNTTQPGAQSTLWLYPLTYSYGPWPNSGEIDVAEWYGTYPDRAVPYLHYAATQPDPDATNNYCYLSIGQPHVFDLDWNTLGLTISYDGNVCIRDTHWLPAGMLTPTPFDKPFFIALTQAPGVGTNAPTSKTPNPSVLKVDYVHVWS